MKTLTGLRRWRDTLVQANSLQDGSYGCALGAMSVELSDNDEQSRQALNASIDAWRRMLVETLTRLRGARGRAAVGKTTKTWGVVLRCPLGVV
ncbi:hypothetical protein ACFU6F_33255, partial [Streptomyces sp. NPDC057460]